MRPCRGLRPRLGSTDMERHMLSNANLVCFSATTNAEASRVFYESVLGLPLLEDTPFALVFEVNRTMLRIQKVREMTPARHTALGWEVSDIRSEIDQLTSKGIRFERYESLPQDDRGIWHSPSGAKVAWFKDSDGNILSLTQWPSSGHSKPAQD